MKLDGGLVQTGGNIILQSKILGVSITRKQNQFPEKFTKTITK